MVNTTKIYRKQSPDTGIEPETSDMPGKRATFTPWTEHHAYLYIRLTKMNNLVNTTKINRKQSPETGIEPETSDMPGKRVTFTPWTEHHA